MRQNVVDGPLDLFGYGWSDRQVRALRMEAVLVRGVANGDGSAVGSGVLELTLGYYHGFALRSQWLRRALLGSGDSVLGLIMETVGSLGRNVLRLPQNGQWHLTLLRHGDSDDSEEYDLKSRLCMLNDENIFIIVRGYIYIGLKVVT